MIMMTTIVINHWEFPMLLQGICNGVVIGRLVVEQGVVTAATLEEDSNRAATGHDYRWC